MVSHKQCWLLSLYTSIEKMANRLVRQLTLQAQGSPMLGMWVIPETIAVYMGFLTLSIAGFPWTPLNACRLLFLRAWVAIIFFAGSISCCALKCEEVVGYLPPTLVPVLNSVLEHCTLRESFITFDMIHIVCIILMPTARMQIRLLREGVHNA